MNKKAITFNSPFGLLTIVEEDDFITELSFGDTSNRQDIIYKETPLLRKVVLELKEYFSGLRISFSVPLNPKGTPFQKEVWKALQDIPYGSTLCYQDVAIKIGNKKAARAIGGANNKNPIAIIIPCHRVIGKNKKLIGYGGGLDKKMFLLNLEKKIKSEV